MCVHNMNVARVVLSVRDKMTVSQTFVPICFSAQLPCDMLSGLNASAVNHTGVSARMNRTYFCLQTDFLISAG